MIGLLLAIIGGVISSFAFLWLSASRQRPLLATVQNPWLTLRVLRRTPEREISSVIEQLFRAWSSKNLDSYLSCWSEDCVRIQGATSNLTQDKSAITEKFKTSRSRYSVISVPTLVIEDIRVAPDGATATAYVYYRFELQRTDGLPVIEHSREVYSLRRTGGTWLIAANLDHFSEITPLASGVQ